MKLIQPRELWHSQSGLSITEILMATAIVGVIIAIATTTAGRLGIRLNAVSKTATKETTFKGFSHNFTLAIEKANVSTHFLNLPLNNGIKCVKSGGVDRVPCVQKLDPNTGFSPYSLKSGNTTISQSQFFRDEQGNVSLAYAFGKRRKEVLYKNFPLSINREGRREAYATWPLHDTNSSPFPLLVDDSDGVHFRFEPELSSSSLNCGMSEYTLFRSSKTNFKHEELEGRLSVIYNSYDLKHFLVQQIHKVFKCAKKKGNGESICADQAREVNAAYDINKLLDDEYYLLHMKIVPNSILSKFTPKFGPSVLSGKKYPGSTKLSQSSILFPTASPSVSFDTKTPACPDAKNFAKIYSGDALRSNIVLLPVDLYSYYLKNGHPDSKGVTRKHLMYRSFNKRRNYQVLRNISKNTTVYFARRYGTKNIEAIFINK